jgi:uncharacterized membrane protein YbaN (DUF454 family)
MEESMKILINTKRIEALKPCQARLDNWMQHYPKFSGDITEFLRLGAITPQDKIWVAVRLMPRFLVEVFAIDCATNTASAATTATAATAGERLAAMMAATTATAATAAYAAAAADDAAAYAAAFAAFAATDDTAADAAAAACAAHSRVGTYAATAAAYAAAFAATDAASERQRQIELLCYLITTTTKKYCEEHQ